MMYCPKGHPLSHIRDSDLPHLHNVWACDADSCLSGWGEVQERPCPRHRCSLCNFDLCARCVGVGRGSRPQWLWSSDDDESYHGEEDTGDSEDTDSDAELQCNPDELSNLSAERSCKPKSAAHLAARAAWVVGLPATETAIWQRVEKTSCLVSHIISLLSDPSDIARARAVSRAWRIAGSEESIWHDLAKQHTSYHLMSLLQSRGKTWCAIYQQRKLSAIPRSNMAPRPLPLPPPRDNYMVGLAINLQGKVGNTSSLCALSTTTGDQLAADNAFQGYNLIIPACDFLTVSAVMLRKSDGKIIELASKCEEWKIYRHKDNRLKIRFSAGGCYIPLFPHAAGNSYGLCELAIEVSVTPTRTCNCDGKLRCDTRHGICKESLSCACGKCVNYSVAAWSVQVKEESSDQLWDTYVEDNVRALRNVDELLAATSTPACATSWV